MDLLLSFEERQLCREFQAVTSVPDGTPKSVVEKLTASTKAFLKRATSSPTARRSFQTPYRNSHSVRTFGAVQLLMKDFRGLPLEDIKRLAPVGGVDALNRALLVRTSEQIQRSGFAFEAEPMRNEPGQTADPAASLRASAASTKGQHTDSASWHRGQAAKATDWFRSLQHHQAADAHSTAARLYPDNDASAAARAASRALVG
jgi:hypothetical protein